MMPRLLVLTALFLASPTSAATKPGKVAVTPASTDAAVMVEAPRLAAGYVLGISAFDPAENNLKTNSFSGGWVSLNVSPAARNSASETAFVVQRVKPGTYVVRDVSQQGAWGVCFGEATVQFSVKPGELLFLGRLDAETPLKELQRNAMIKGHYSARNGTIYHYVEGITPPAFAATDPAALAAAEAFARANMPKTTVKPQPVIFTPARFGTGKSLFGQDVCGGYFRNKVPPVATAK